ncbi:hypothetical protein KGP36_04945 [Patescibacteria group bacterium]|nr:hypothetical protein [Patescibacteria group bacterium]MDE1941114.1 hypothetical protein [Patescibacteria group bacterium]
MQIIETILSFFGCKMLAQEQPHSPKTNVPEWIRRRTDPSSWPHQKEFIDFFGFKPALIDDDRYKKEILLKLGFMAIQLNGVAVKARRSPDIYRSAYKSASREYSQMLESIARFDPQFEKQIPHWTILPQFCDEWLSARKSDSKNFSTVTIGHCVSD